MGVVWGHGHVDWGCGSYRVWFVPEAILEKLEPMFFLAAYMHKTENPVHAAFVTIQTCVNCTQS